MSDKLSKLSAHNLSVGYTQNGTTRVVVKNINIALAKGQLIGLVGINGSGKSTLLRTLAGLQKPLKGVLRFKGTALKNISTQQLAKELSVVLTNQPISKNLTVVEMVSLGRQPYTNWLGTLSKGDEAVVLEALTHTDILEIMHRRCFELSDGQLQRVYIARAIAQETDIILLDEPMTHLDLHHKAAILKLLTKIAHIHKKTVVFSTHDIEHTLHRCDTMIVIKEALAVHKKPMELISDGVFDTLFPTQNIYFNRENRTFSFR